MTSNMKKPCKVFISYQWGAQEKIKKLYEALDSFEIIDVWMDIHKIKAGMSLFQALAIGVQQCDVLLPCVTRKYMKSKNCEREITYADYFNKPIIPVYIEKIPPEELGSIGFLLARERFCNMYRNESVFENLKDSAELRDILCGIANALKVEVMLKLY
jgi:hypothetical protein